MKKNQIEISTNNGKIFFIISLVKSQSSLSSINDHFFVCGFEFPIHFRICIRLENNFEFSVRNYFFYLNYFSFLPLNSLFACNPPLVPCVRKKLCKWVPFRSIAQKWSCTYQSCKEVKWISNDKNLSRGSPIISSVFDIQRIKTQFFLLWTAQIIFIDFVS